MRVCRATVLSMAAVGLLAAGVVFAQSSGDALEEGFRNPSDSARPRTWWHWTNGNVTEDGITKDLEWMKRSDIGGFQLVDVAAGSGQEVEKKINFGTPEWYHAVRHSAEEAKRLGLEMSIFSSPGWSEAGGPWVKPEQAMKKLVWSETNLHGPQAFASKLLQPPSNEGPVRDLSIGARSSSAPQFYADSAVIAYRTPADDTPMASLHLKVTTNAGPIDAAALLDDSLNTSINIVSPADGSPAWLQYEFATPYTARAMTIGSHNRIPVGKILASDDGTNFHTIVVMPGPQGYHGAAVRTFAFPAVTAKFFRIELEGAGLLPAAVIHGGPTIAAPQYTLTEAILYSSARVNRWEDKGAFGSLMDVYDVVPTPSAPSTAEGKLWGNDDPVFPATRIEQGADCQFKVAGLDRTHWSSASPIRQIFRCAFERAELPYFNPHSFRNTLVRLGQDLCRSPEAFKAWSQNLGHEKVLATFLSYGTVASDRQGEIIRDLITPQRTQQSEHVQIAKAVLTMLRDEGVNIQGKEEPN